MHLRETPQPPAESTSAGGFATILNGGISALFVTLIREPLLIVVFLGLAFALSWKLTLISLVVFPFSLAIISWIAIRLHRERGVSQERLADITSIVQESISGVKVVMRV